MSWSTVFAQIPSQCGSAGCSSSDVKIVSASITNATGAYFVCLGNEVLNDVYLNLFVSTNSKRVGVFISATVNVEANGNLNSFPIQHCFTGAQLNGSNNKLSVLLPPNTFSCGSNVTLTNIFVAWGTGNSDFCGGQTGVQCPGTPSKCSYPTGIVIFVQTTPCTVPNITTHPQNLTRCVNSTASFSVAYQPSSDNLVTTTVKWQIQNGNSFDDLADNAIYSGTSTNSLVVNQLSGLNGKVYRAAVTHTSSDVNLPADKRSCTGYSTAATLTVNPLSSGGTLSGTQTICSGNQPNSSLELSNYTGSIVRWEKSNSSAFSIITNIVSTDATLTPQVVGSLTQDTWFRAVVKSGECAAVNSPSIKISVDQNPSNASAGSTQERCGTLVSLGLGGNSPAIGSGSWSKKSGPGNVSFSPNATTPNATATVSQSGSYVFTWTISNGTCESKSADITVHYYQSPGAPTADVLQPTCSVNYGKISVTSGTTGLSFSLNSTNPLDFTNTSGVFDNLAPGEYVIRARNSSGCISAPLSKTVNSLASSTPAADVVILTHPSCSSSQGSLKVVRAGSLQEYDNTIYEFSNGGNFTSNPVFSFVAGAGYNIVVRNKNDHTCFAIASCAGENSLQPDAVQNMQGNEVRVRLDAPAQALTVKAFPNPYRDQIKFVITSGEKGMGSLELYNLSGQRVKLVYSGIINEGLQYFETAIPLHMAASLIYVFRINGQQVTGKLLNASR